MSHRILICDDQDSLRETLAEHLTSQGYQVKAAKNAHECIQAVCNFHPDVLLLDMNLPDASGLDVLRELHTHDKGVLVMVITGYGAVNNAIEASKLGAKAYVQKPFDFREIDFQIEKIVAEHKLALEAKHFKTRQLSGCGQLLGNSKPMKNIFEILERIADVDATAILLTGESGTGKNLLAQMIHAKGKRQEHLYLEIDCAALPEHLIESELFGHEKGAFTDAHQMKRGLFEVANKGTIFLDEIGEMPITTQAKLLRVLENRKFKRLGGLVDLSFDAAIIAATNRNLQELVAKGQFREDLYFRLHVLPIEVPSLRERKADIPLLAKSFVTRFNAQLGRQTQGFTKEALAALEDYHWPGNIRELKNVIERTMILYGDKLHLERFHLPEEVRTKQFMTSLPGEFTLPENGIDLQLVEESLIKQALNKTEQNQSKAASLLGISRFALRNRMKKFGLLSG